jgi:hypothetical protein
VRISWYSSWYTLASCTAVGAVGAAVGVVVDAAVGAEVGLSVGDGVGAAVGVLVGTWVGADGAEDICIHARKLNGIRPLRAGDSFKIELAQAAVVGEWSTPVSWRSTTTAVVFANRMFVGALASVAQGALVAEGSTVHDITAVGAVVGTMIGAVVGAVVVAAVGTVVGTMIGAAVGDAVGTAIGAVVGDALGTAI